MEQRHLNALMVVVSDLWLDCPRTMQKFEQLLKSLTVCESTIPAAMILQGPFVSNPIPNLSLVAHFQNLFNILALVIQKFPQFVQQTRFFLQPSLEDLLAPNTLPRMPIPVELLKPLLHAGIDVMAISNPSRIFAFTKEIAVMRYDWGPQLRRPGVILKGLEGSRDGKVFRWMLEQAHTCPVSLAAQPRHWDYDHALCIYPLPDLVNYSCVSSLLFHECMHLNS